MSKLEKLELQLSKVKRQMEVYDGLSRLWLKEKGKSVLLTGEEVEVVEELINGTSAYDTIFGEREFQIRAEIREAIKEEQANKVDALTDEEILEAYRAGKLEIKE